MVCGVVFFKRRWRKRRRDDMEIALERMLRRKSKMKVTHGVGFPAQEEHVEMIVPLI